MRPRWLFALPALLLIAVLAACGGGGGYAKTPGAEVRVTLTDSSLKPEPASVPAGKITFVAMNSGTVEHELVILKTDLPVDALKVSGNKVDEKASGHEIGEIDEFKAGKTESKTFTLQSGEYVLFCNIAGHYQQGIRSAFTVQ